MTNPHTLNALRSCQYQYQAVTIVYSKGACGSTKHTWLIFQTLHKCALYIIAIYIL